ncbi:MAG: carotenoid oxygenase family protein [Ilumatobacteraceae bacterium]
MSPRIAPSSPVSRRDLVRWGLMGGSTAALLAACRAAVEPTATTPRTSVFAPPIAPTTSPPVMPPTTVAIDPTHPWWLQGNFAPVDDELDVTDLEVRGNLPADLAGHYVKNGSNPPHADSPHWFFGDGMVHAVTLEDGRATAYRNRWVRTEPFLAGAGFGQGVPGGGNSQSNVSALWHGGALLTSGEIGFPYRLDPRTLETIGTYDFGGVLTQSFTAHPKIDPVTGRMHAFGYGFASPYLWYYVVEPDGTMSSLQEVPLPRSTMIHDFAITETDVVFWDMPVVFDMQRAVEFINDPTSGAMPYVWQPDAGSRIGIMPLGGPASEIRWFDLDPCYVFHSVNAFRRGDEVVVDVGRLASSFAVGSDDIGDDASLRRWTIDTASGRVADDVLETDDPGDLPSRDPRRVGREHRYGYLVGTRPNATTVELGDLIKHDFARDTRQRWRVGATRHASEPLFVPADDDAEDGGWLLSFVHDDAVDETVLAVLDATDVSAGPVAEVVMPRRVPYGFHATWIASTGD